MTRPLLVAREITKAFGSRTILSHASFSLAEGERAAIVGPNGSGKTTILNMLTGRMKPDMGEIELEASLRYGYMTQTFEFAPEATVESILAAKPPQVEKLESEIGEIEARMADAAFYEEPGYEDVLTRYGELQREVQGLASKGDMTAALRMLQDLGLGEIDPATRMRSLSGGEKTRVLLAKALANWKEMDLLILDEPTNHLDIETVEWLERFLTEEYEGALILIAHDQYLMDNLAEKILEIDNFKVWEWEGNFSDYRDQKAAYNAAIEARRKREFEEMKRQVAIIEEIKRRNRFDAQARSKERRLDRAKRGMLGSNTGQSQKAFRLDIRATRKSSNDVLSIDRLMKKAGEDVLFHDAELVLGKGDKVGLIGPNGCGKTTLLRMITGLAKPDAGKIDVSPGVKIGYFDQEHAGLHWERTLIEEVRAVRPERMMPEEEARGLLGRFLFKGDDAFKEVGKLSGGEKARLALLKFLVGETNLLVLDEPTNHLDLQSQEVVENALREYTGSILVVSHDRHFLDAIVNKIAVVANGRIGVFPGNFSETRTLTRLTEFMGGEGETKEYKVRKSFADYESGKRYAFGERVKVTGGETQTTKRLLRLAISRGWLELVE